MAGPGRGGDKCTVTGILIWYEGATLATRKQIFTDHQGSVVSVTDGGGTAIAINTYDEWGVPGASNTGRFQYTGQAWLAELGMYYYKARIYSPTLGRFMQTDPIGYNDEVNLYSYVRNAPVDGVDPSGTCTGSLISDPDGGCKGGGFVNGAGSCSGQCTSARDQFGAAYDSALSQANSSNTSSNNLDCEMKQGCAGRIPSTLLPILRALLNDKNFKSTLLSAWVMSRPFSATNQKNEHGFWTKVDGGGVSNRAIFGGSGDHINLSDVLSHWSGTENVLSHIHPFFSGEVSGSKIYLNGWSPGDIGILKGLNVVGVALGHDGLYYYDGRQ